MENKTPTKWYKKLIRRFRNKFLLTFSIFFVYTLFIDDNDIFTIVNHHIRLNKLEKSLAIKEQKLKETKLILNELNNPFYIEKYARENKYFKKDNEDIFVITYK